MDDPYLKQVAQEIREWEGEPPQLFGRLSRMVAEPLYQIAVTLVPLGVQEELSHLVEEPLVRLQRLGANMVDGGAIRARVRHLKDAGLAEFEARDWAARRSVTWGLAAVGAEGFLASLAGWAGLLADAPLLYMLTLRTIAGIATAYETDLDEPAEQEYLLEVLRCGLEVGVEERIASVLHLKAVEIALMQEATLAIRRAAVSRAILHETSHAAGSALVGHRALRLLPIVGAVCGGALNIAFLREVARTAYMSYRRRSLGHLIEEASE